MKGKERGIGYAHPAGWTTSFGAKKTGSVMINARLALDNFTLVKECRWTSLYSLEKTPSVMVKHSRVHIVEDIEHDFVVYPTKSTTECKRSILVTIVEENELVEFRGLKSTLLTGFISHLKWIFRPR